MVGFVDKLVVSVVEVEVEMEERKEKEDKGKENQSDQKKLISGMREEEKWMRETQRNKADGEAFRRRRRRSTSLRLLFFSFHVARRSLGAERQALAQTKLFGVVVGDVAVPPNVQVPLLGRVLGADVLAHLAEFVPESNVSSEMQSRSIVSRPVRVFIVTSITRGVDYFIFGRSYRYLRALEWLWKWKLESKLPVSGVAFLGGCPRRRGRRR